MPTTTKKPRVVIPTNPSELIALGQQVGTTIGNMEGTGGFFDNPTMVFLAEKPAESAAAALAHQQAYEAADATKKIEREARDIDLDDLINGLRLVRDHAFGLITDGNYAKLGDLGFTVLVTESESGGSGGSGSESVDDNGEFVPAS